MISLNVTSSYKYCYILTEAQIILPPILTPLKFELNLHGSGTAMIIANS